MDIFGSEIFLLMVPQVNLSGGQKARGVFRFLTERYTPSNTLQFRSLGQFVSSDADYTVFL